VRLAGRAAGRMKRREDSSAGARSTTPAPLLKPGNQSMSSAFRHCKAMARAAHRQR